MTNIKKRCFFDICMDTKNTQLNNFFDAFALLLMFDFFKLTAGDSWILIFFINAPYNSLNI